MPSTSIGKIQYDPTSQTLSVWFVASGNRYDYQDVPPQTYERFVKAWSKGRYFNAFIRDKVRYELIKREDLPHATPRHRSGAGAVR